MGMRADKSGLEMHFATSPLCVACGSCKEVVGTVNRPLQSGDRVAVVGVILFSWLWFDGVSAVGAVLFSCGVRSSFETFATFETGVCVGTVLFSWRLAGRGECGRAV